MSRIDRLTLTSDRGFRIHGVVFVLVMTLLVVINLLDTSNIWVVWPLFGWGAGLAMHAFAFSANIKRLRAEAERLRASREAGMSPSI